VDCPERRDGFYLRGSVNSEPESERSTVNGQREAVTRYLWPWALRLRPDNDHEEHGGILSSGRYNSQVLRYQAYYRTVGCQREISTEDTPRVLPTFSNCFTRGAQSTRRRMRKMAPSAPVSCSLQPAACSLCLDSSPWLYPMLP